MPNENQSPANVGGPSRLWSRIGWIGFFLCAALLFRHYVAEETYFDTTNGISERYHSGNTSSWAKEKVAILTLSGVIMDGDGFIKNQIDRVMADKSVNAVVLRINSPGGAVYGSDYIYHHLKKLRQEREIPIVVSMGSVAASGGYYVAMAVGDEENVIFAEPTTVTGSIGVIIPHYDISGLLKRYDIKNDSIASHPRKQMLSMTREMPAEHREILDGQVNEYFERFKQIIQDGRPKLRNDTNELKHGEIDLATGEVFSGTKAKELGLVDRIGFIEDAIQRAIELARLRKDNVQVVQFRAPNTIFSLPLIQSRSDIRSELFQSLLEFTTPRAYYLASDLPLGPMASEERE